MASWALELDRFVTALQAAPIEPEVREQLRRWLELLELWSAKTDLTGAKTPAAMLDVMVTDALVLATMMPEGAHVLDVGAGAGGPTIPLVLLRPDLRATLLEPRARRVAFLRTSVGTLGIVGRVRVVAGKLDTAHPRRTPGLGLDGSAPGGSSRDVHARTERLAPFDVALSRATFAPEVWLPLGLAIAPRVVVLSTHPISRDATEVRLEAERGYRSASGDSPRWAALLTRRS